jgi:hypothetical protein
LTLNLRFDSLEARHLGVEGHVCEVQLTSKGFVNLLVCTLYTDQKLSSPSVPDGA